MSHQSCLPFSGSATADPFKRLRTDRSSIAPYTYKQSKAMFPLLMEVAIWYTLDAHSLSR